MKLHKYLKNGGAPALARALKMRSPVSVNQWKTGKRKVPAERCPDIELATGGKVTCEDLREDVNWSVLRRCSCKDKAA